MTPLRRLLLLCALIVSIVLLDIHLPSRFPSTDSDSDPRPEPDRSGGFRAFFSFRTPLFAPSAIISLANDNSTFFLARPAAFGPFLPSTGLSGQLWIAPGLFDGGRLIYDGNGPAVSGGELGCGDVPGWETLREGERHAEPHRRVAAVAPEMEIFEKSNPSNVQDDHETDEMVGKVVLVPRGKCSFYDKTMWAQRRGAIAIVVGDTVPGGPLVTMYANGDTSNISIPAIFTSYTTARLLSALAPDASPRPNVPDEVDIGGPRDGSQGHSSSLQRYPAPRGVIRNLWSRGGCLPGSCVRTGAARPSTNHANTLHKSDPETESPLRDDSSMAPSSSPHRPLRDEIHPSQHNLKLGVWVTLTPTSLSASPFLDTLLVLVVSPLVTLTIVYGLLILRHRIRRRHWRAPKRVVQQLPVRIYREPRSSRFRDRVPTPPFEPGTAVVDEQTPLLSTVCPHLGTMDPQPSSSATRRPMDLSSASVDRSSEAVEPSTGRTPATFPVHNEPTPEDDPSKDEALTTSQTAQSVGFLGLSSPSRRARWSRTLRGIFPGSQQDDASDSPDYPGSIRENEASEESESSSRLPQTTCAVCCDEYVHGVSLVMTLPCGHEFHQECITEWLVTRRGICPVCRHDVVQGVRQGADPRRGSAEHA